ncbi:Ulp1 family isopeptidase [Xanthomonas nasturtii]|uniref:C48 family peptidase n=1 Tax=Xanthomonas nasturtii TaxID=1843581 RepID=A0ABT0LWQ7_9XANT|nr:Ulp1 family isopeptidase [Xanthomonas nasturtii]MCL1553770.1 C48 family peptidase [Xanthomonas nasturtii]MCL1557759.1 C48 family peptidase [Xanthomonas nasturtii]
MHPLLESLPRRNPTQVHADGSVHRMRAAAPTSETHIDYSKLLELIGAYGDDKDMRELQKRFHGFSRFLTVSGLSHISGKQMLQELNEDQRDQVIHQIIRRIEHSTDPEYREIALSRLESQCSRNIVLSPWALDRIAQAKAKAETETNAKAKTTAKAKTETTAKAKAKTMAKAKAEAIDVAQRKINEIIEYLPIYEALGKVPPALVFSNYMHVDGSFGKTLRNILPYITPDQKKRFDLASERRKLALAAQSKPLKGVFRTLHQNPDLLLEISSKFRNRAYRIENARSGYLSQARLEEMVDQETGELTRLGEAVISGASQGIQTAIRANFRMRYQQPDLPPNSHLQAFHRPEETWHPDTPAGSSYSSYSSLLPPTPYGGWPQNASGEWHPDTPADSSYSSYSSYSSLLPPTPYGGWPQNASGEWHPDTPAGSSYPAWPAQPEASSSTFDDLESLDNRQNYYYREFDINTPQEIEQPGGWRHDTPAQSTPSTFDGLSSMSHYGREFDLNTPQEIEQPGGWQHATPAQSTDSTFDGLSSMSHYGREFDLNTPHEEEEPWDYGTQTPVGHSAMSPERIDVDNLPSPQDVPDSELPPVTATSWLQDGHLRAYTDDLARRLQGQPNAHLLHFADSQVVTMLSSTDPDQQARARRLLVGDEAPPIVFLPINQPNFHWSLLVVDRRDKGAVAAYYYDSMAQTQPQQRYLADMAAYHLGLDHEQTQEMPTAIQPDGYSCGDHVLTGMETLAHRVIDGTFDSADGRNLSEIEPDCRMIRDRLVQADQAPAESSVRQVSERSNEQKKKKSKWWKKF